MRHPFWCWVNGGHLYKTSWRSRFDNEAWTEWQSCCLFCGKDKREKRG